MADWLTGCFFFYTTLDCFFFFIYIMETAQIQPFSRMLLVSFSRFFLYSAAFECNKTSDWLNHTVKPIRSYVANHKLCYIQIHKAWRKRQRMFLRMPGEYGSWILPVPCYGTEVSYSWKLSRITHCFQRSSNPGHPDYGCCTLPDT